MTSRPGNASRLQDTRAFRKMWSDGLSAADIGARVNLTQRRVADLARSYGYPARTQAGVLLGPMPQKPAQDEPACASISCELSKQTDGRWSAEQDAKIIAARGRYAEVSSLAKVFDRSITTVLQRWHQLRVQ